MEYATASRIQNTIFWSNASLLAGAEILATNGAVKVAYSDVDGGVMGAKCAGGGIVDGGGNLGSDPRFVNPLSPAGPDGLLLTADDGLRLDAQLAFVNPCIDAATSTGAPSQDIIGLSPNISQPARNADSPERGHLARLGRSKRVSGQDARAPASGKQKAEMGNGGAKLTDYGTTDSTGPVKGILVAPADEFQVTVFSLHRCYIKGSRGRRPW